MNVFLMVSWSLQKRPRARISESNLGTLIEELSNDHSLSLDPNPTKVGRFSVDDPDISYFFTRKL